MAGMPLERGVLACVLGGSVVGLWAFVSCKPAAPQTPSSAAVASAPASLEAAPAPTETAPTETAPVALEPAPPHDGTTFHRIYKGFMIQGGDPVGNGTGGQSAWGGKFADEITAGSELYRAGYKRGIVAMANAGPNTNTSQFFIMHQDYPLPPSYVIFGKVTKGLEVVDALATTPTTMGLDRGMSQPLTPQIIRKVTIRP